METARFQEQKSFDRIRPTVAPVVNRTRENVENFLRLAQGFMYSSIGKQGSIVRKESGDLEFIMPELVEEAKLGTDYFHEKKELVKLLEEKSKQVVASLALAKSVFARDQPYRTRLSLSNSFTTGATGVLNYQQVIHGIDSTQEWSSLQLLFDEFFVHSVTVNYFPLNEGGHGINSAAAHGASYPVTAAGGGATVAMSAGVIIIPLFNVTGFYSTADGMLNTQGRKLVHTGVRWKFRWRNNVRFDPHGLALSPAASTAWQGWNANTAFANLGGAIQARAVRDQVLGDGAHTIQTGVVIVDWDASFRTRA